MSNYAVDALFKSFLEEHPNFGPNMTYTWFKTETSVWMDTTIMNFFAPGIEEMYGADRPIDIKITIHELKDIHSVDTQNLTG